MRKGLPFLALLLLFVLPVATGAGQLKRTPRPGDGTLAITGGRGQVEIKARGAVIGQVRRGVVRIKRGPSRTVVYRGRNIRIRIVDSRFRLVIRGVGIHLSAVGKGTVGLQGDPRFESNGYYSLNGDPLEPFPQDYTEFALAAP